MFYRLYLILTSFNSVFLKPSLCFSWGPFVSINCGSLSLAKISVEVPHGLRWKDPPPRALHLLWSGDWRGITILNYKHLRFSRPCSSAYPQEKSIIYLGPEFQRYYAFFFFISPVLLNAKAAFSTIILVWSIVWQICF